MLMPGDIRAFGEQRLHAVGIADIDRERESRVPGALGLEAKPLLVRIGPVLQQQTGSRRLACANCDQERQGSADSGTVRVGTRLAHRLDDRELADACAVEQRGGPGLPARPAIPIHQRAN